ncbi:MAG: DMT family transporter [Candidatus Woesearchaeota archaeon]|nr:MAG: DMT family transporter [Candidatus Woesearchaeota archaeon]
MINRKVLFVILISVLAAAVTAVIARVAYSSGNINPLSYSMNVLLMTLVFFTLFTILRKEPLRNFSKRIWIHLVVLGIGATTLGMGLYYIGLNYTTAINTTFIMRLQVPFAALFAFFILGDKLTKKQICATIIMFIGVYLLMFGFNIIHPNFGDLIILAATAVFGFTHSYYKKTLAKEVPIFSVLFYRSVFGVGALALLVALVLKEQAFQAILTIPYLVTLQALIYTVYMYGLYYGIKEIGPGPTTIFYLIVPLITAILAFIILGESLVVTQGFGAALVLIGSYFMIKNK